MISAVATYRDMRCSPFPTLRAAAALSMFLIAGCGTTSSTPLPPSAPTPVVTANAYILPGAVALGQLAFGDEPVVVYRGERLRWVNVDGVAHTIVADSPDATDFRGTVELPPNGEQSFDMTRLGTTGIHCVDHPNMTGTLIVRGR